MGDVTGKSRAALHRWASSLLRRARQRLYRQGIVVQRAAFPVNEAALERTGRYYPVDFEECWIETIERVRGFTQTSPDRLAALCAAVEYVARRPIAGAVVECGVWRGGSMMAAALRLLRLQDAERELYLYDTYAGMPTPDAVDVDYAGRTMHPGDNWAPADEVNRSLLSTGYDATRIHLVQGDVRETIPDRAPEQIAVLRLDTDWYESTRHELEHLYPRLAAGGILIIDDYGHFRGARQAVDEYFSTQPVFLSRIDYTGRLLVKPSEP